MVNTAPVQAGPAPVQAGPALRPVWQRLRFWLALVAIAVIGAGLAALLSNPPGRTLDPGSASKGGSKALAQLLRENGALVTSTSELASAERAGSDAAVVVVAPDDYSSAQLATLSGGAGRLVLLAPAPESLAAATSAVAPDDTTSGTTDPGCNDPGAVAAGEVDLPADTDTYLAQQTGTSVCFGGAFVRSGRLVVLGSVALLRNDHLADRGVAALDINAITADRSVTAVVWLMPGADAAGTGAPNVWSLFPSSAHRAFWWLICCGLLVVLWRGRRLGPVVFEPLPVLVRAAELVEGHGRLYRRAGARDRAAAALRTATTQRLAARLCLPPRARTGEVVAALAEVTGTHARELAQLLEGPAPADDTGLIALSSALHDLEATAGVPSRPRGSP
jgi:hypothetical protein